MTDMAFSIKNNFVTHIEQNYLLLWKYKSTININLVLPVVIKQNLASILFYFCRSIIKCLQISFIRL